jgi:small subunit ribosomal protein S16
MVKMRLSRRGRKKMALFDIIVADARAPRDGRFIEKVGTYNPNTVPATVVLNEEAAFKWIMNGVQPTDTVRTILSMKGLMFKRHLQIGVNKGAITQEQADAKLASWIEQKEDKVKGTAENLAKKKADAKKAQMEAETKVKDARAQAIAKKKAPAPTPEETPAENTLTENPEGQV